MSTQQQTAAFKLPDLTVPDKPVRGGISPDVIARYGCGLDEHNNFVFPYYTNGRVVGAKVRAHGVKEFWFQGNAKDVQLFGMQCANGDRRIVVTEGEFDALAVTEMTGYPAVSIPFGADSVEKHIKKTLQWLEQFETIYLCLDQDDHGQRATQLALKLLKPGKARVVTLPVGYKDANDMLKAGKGEEFKRCLYAAQGVLPSGLVSKDELKSRTLSFLRDKNRRTGVPTGYSGLDDLIGGWREGELHTVVAGTGIGKSTLTRNFVWRQMQQGRKCLYIPLEDLTEVATIKFVEMDLQQALIKCTTQMPEEQLQASLDKVLDNLVVFDQKGAMTVDELVSAVEYVVRTEDVKFIVLDHITAMANSLEGESERKALDICIEALKLRIAVALRTTVVVVSHISRDRNDDEDNEPTLSRVKGASSIAQLSDSVLAAMRNRDSDTTTIKTLKANRLWGVYGSFDVTWSEETQQLEEPRNAYYEEEKDVHQAQPAKTTAISQPVRTDSVGSEQPERQDGSGVRDNETGVPDDTHLHARPDPTERVGSGDEGAVHTTGQSEAFARQEAARKRRNRRPLPEK